MLIKQTELIDHAENGGTSISCSNLLTCLCVMQQQLLPNILVMFIDIENVVL